MTSFAPSPLVLINSTPQLDGVNVSPNTLVGVALASTVGVSQWALSIIGTDELVVSVPVITQTAGFNASFTMPNYQGSALLFQSQINGGIDNSGAPNASYTTTFTVYTVSSDNFRVGALGETLEGSPYGWLTKLNPIIRGNGTTTPGGPASGDLASNYPAPTVVSISGASPFLITPSVLEFLKATVSPTITQQTRATDVPTQNLSIITQAPWASASTNTSPGNLVMTVPSAVNGGTQGSILQTVGAITTANTTYAGTLNTQNTNTNSTLYFFLRTTNATPTTIATLAIPTGTCCFVATKGAAKDAVAGTVGDSWAITQNILVKNVSGTAAIVHTGPSTTYNDTSMSSCALSFSVSSGNLIVQVAGLSATTIDWSIQLANLTC